jgi:hypothetical protein
MKHSALALAFLASRISSSAGQGGGGGGGAVVPRYEKISLLRRGADPAALAPSSSSLSNTAIATADDADASPPSSDDDEEDDDMAIQAKCQPLRESECDHARDCAWCVSRAVPSKCYASSLVARLPAKTFECAAGTTTASASSSASSAEKKETKEEKNEVFEDEDDDIIRQNGCYPLSDIECDRARNCQWCEDQCIDKDDPCPIAETTSASSSASSAEKKKTKETKNKVVEVFDFAGGTTLTLSSAEVDKTFCDASSPISLAGYMNGELLFDFYFFRLGWGRGRGGITTTTRHDGKRTSTSSPPALRPSPLTSLFPPME